MTVYTPTAHAHHIAAIRADLNQLRSPIPRPPVPQRIRIAGHRTRTHHELPPLPPLLVMLRQAADGQHSTPRGPQRHTKPASRPPGNLDALDLLARIYIGISTWHGGLNLPSPPHDTDWQLHALAQLHDEARRWTPDLLDTVAADVHQWWRWAAFASGLAQDELRALRGLTP